MRHDANDKKAVKQTFKAWWAKVGHLSWNPVSGLYRGFDSSTPCYGEGTNQKFGYRPSFNGNVRFATRFTPMPTAGEVLKKVLEPEIIQAAKDSIQD